MSSTIDPSIATNSSSNRWTRILGEWPPPVVFPILVNILYISPLSDSLTVVWLCMKLIPGPHRRCETVPATALLHVQTTVSCLFARCWHLLIITDYPVRSGDTRVFEVIPDLSRALMTQPCMYYPQPDPRPPNSYQCIYTLMPV